MSRKSNAALTADNNRKVSATNHIGRDTLFRKSQRIFNKAKIKDINLSSDDDVEMVTAQSINVLKITMQMKKKSTSQF